MPPTSARLSLAALVFTLLLGCQSDTVPEGAYRAASRDAVPIYSRDIDAQAVAMGAFGAMPVEISSQSALTLLSKPCDTTVAEVRSHSGKVGWIPVDDLPANLQKQPCARSSTRVLTPQRSSAAAQS